MLSCWDADPQQRPTFVTTTTSVLDPLADYLDVTTFVTGEEQEAETAIMESQVVESDKETSKEETNADLQGGAHEGARSAESFPPSIADSIALNTPDHSHYNWDRCDHMGQYL